MGGSQSYLLHSSPDQERRRPRRTFPAALAEGGLPPRQPDAARRARHAIPQRHPGALGIVGKKVD